MTFSLLISVAVELAEGRAAPDACADGTHVLPGADGKQAF